MNRSGSFLVHCSPSLRSLAWTTAALLFVVLSGCGGSDNPAEQFMVMSPPAGEQSISDIRAALKADDAADSMDVVVRGRINAGESSPWVPDFAAFVLTDATGHDGDEEHDPHKCPFCSREIVESIAQVRFFAEDGGLIPTDAREFLGVDEYQLVVIAGSGKINEESDTLEINAAKIFIHR